jgi:uncharacterized membrane protein YgcG
MKNLARPRARRSSAATSPRRVPFPRAAVALSAMSAVALLLSAAAAEAEIKVAVIGPQHVHSHQLTRDKEYPAMLQTLLGAEYLVGNFGDCCATILQGYPKQKETHPYLESGEAYPAVGGMNFKDSVKFMPNIAVIGPWGKHDTEIANQLYKGMLDRAKLEADFDELVTTYRNLPTKPQVIVLTPIPIPFGEPVGVTTTVLLPAIKAVAAKYQLPVVDVYSAFLNKKELFKDETHITNDAGLHTLADMVFAVMKASPPGGGGTAPGDGGSAGGTPDASAAGGASGGGGSAAGGASGSGGDATATGGASAAGGSSASSGGNSGSAGTTGSGGSKATGGSAGGATASGGANGGGSSSPPATSEPSPSACTMGGDGTRAGAFGSGGALLVMAALALVLRARRCR